MTYWQHNDIRKKLIFSLCRYVVMLLSNKCEQLRHNDTTNHQLESGKNCQTQSHRARFIIAASPPSMLELKKPLGQEQTVRLGEVSDIDKLLAEAVQGFPVLYDKSLIKDFSFFIFFLGPIYLTNSVDEAKYLFHPPADVAPHFIEKPATLNTCLSHPVLIHV